MAKLAAAIWLTGLSGVGKTTLANGLAQELTARGISHRVLDGDILRTSLWPELGFSEVDRNKNIERTAELAYTLQQQGLVVIVSLISPYAVARNEAIKKLQASEVYLEASLETLQQRDPKGLYKRAMAGELTNLTGVSASAPYQAPITPALHLRTDVLTIEQCLAKLVALTLATS